MRQSISRRNAMSLTAIGVLAAYGARGELHSADPPRTQRIAMAGGRLCTVTVWPVRKSRGTILFSHGALSSPAKYAMLIDAWARAGFEVWAPLHVDSTDHPDTRAFPGLTSWAARLEDMAALSAHVGAPHPVAAGHSYGALVALTMGGAAAERPEGYAGAMRDPSVRAVVAFSPPGPAKGLVTADGYAALSVAALIQTGTADIPPPSMGGDAGWRAHLAAYDAAVRGGERYALVLDGVDHYFGGAICRPELPGPRQTAQFANAVEISRLFLEAYEEQRQSARRALVAHLGKHGPAQLSMK